jgi:hypothetical protein
LLGRFEIPRRRCGADPASIPAELTFLNVPTRGCGQKASMSQPSTIAERLLAHARIRREIADATLNEETASELERLAEDCIQAARDADPAPQRQMFPSLAGRRRATG